MKKLKPNMRKNNKHAEAREWAHDLLTSSPGTPASEIAGMMAEQFKKPKAAMLHTLGQMLRVGILKSSGRALHNGKYTHILSVGGRRKHRVNGHGEPEVAATPVPIVNKTGSIMPMKLSIPTAEGDMTLSIAQARELYVTLGELFK